MGFTCSYRLACDMGAAPSILQVLAFGPIVFLTWALGPNFNTKFRLVGPWKWDGAAAVIKGEHWKVIKRRKGFISKFERFSLNPSNIRSEILLTCDHFQFGPVCRSYQSLYSVPSACSTLLYTELKMLLRGPSYIRGCGSSRRRSNPFVAKIRRG